ncbi:MAG: hypothetical protein JNJ73_19085 [Hyphomonadaceae bacterium]|nr:hypothetical protein [Hyphomonadaceae bacterium]
MGVFERYIVVFMRTYLGAFNLASGLNYFFLFYPQPIPADPLGRAYMGSTLDLGLFQLAKVVETIAGLCLLTNTMTPLALVLLFPVTANIFVMNTFHSPMAHVQVSGARNFAFHGLLFAAYAQHFYGLLKVSAPLAPVWRTYKRMKDHF